MLGLPGGFWAYLDPGKPRSCHISLHKINLKFKESAGDRSRRINELLQAFQESFLLKVQGMEEPLDSAERRPVTAQSLVNNFPVTEHKVKNAFRPEAAFR